MKVYKGYRLIPLQEEMCTNLINYEDENILHHIHGWHLQKWYVLDIFTGLKFWYKILSEYVKFNMEAKKV